MVTAQLRKPAMLALIVTFCPAANILPKTTASASTTVTTAQFSGVSCFAFDACVAVGYWRPDERAAPQHFAARWNGHSWTLLPTPAGHNPSYLFSADCVSALCLLVGEWTDSSGRFVPLAEEWNKAGTVKVTPAPLPSGNEAAAIRSVSCLSAAYCLAAGDQVIAGSIRPLTMMFDGSSWSAITTPAPDSPVARLTGISCVPQRFMASFWCQAVGWSQTPSGRAAPLALSWDGTTWTVEHVDNPHGNRASNQFRAVSCRQTLCLAVGLSAAPDTKTILAERLVSRTGGAPTPGDHQWRAETTIPRPPHSGKTILNSVSCRFANVCRGAGAFYDRAHQRWSTLIDVWQDRWQLNTTALCFHRCTASVPTTPDPTNMLSAVSCVTYNACLAVGTTVGRRGPVLVTTPLALWLRHTAGLRWVLAPPPNFVPP